VVFVRPVVVVVINDNRGALLIGRSFGAVA
jgi:hypothetical protein